MILSGVRIENKVVIGAGSVVTKNLESGFVYAGVPAKKIRKI
jgi:maltose O-acetyltransferase